VPIERWREQGKQPQFTWRCDLQVTLHATRRRLLAGFPACLGALAIAFLLMPWRIRVPTTWSDEPTAANSRPKAQRGDDPGDPVSPPTATGQSPARADISRRRLA
jgi:hypothetical protein